MHEIDKPKIEDLADELDFWNAFRQPYLTKSIDIAQLHLEWAAEVEQRLNSPGGREDFAELCKAGCLPQGLAALIILLRYTPSLEEFWTLMVGHPNNRAKATHALEEAAHTLEMLYAGIIALGTEAENERFTKIGRVPVSRIISELRIHIRFINFAQRLRRDTEARSLAEVSKYLLTSYVRRMTGHFHDRSVSGLIGEIVDSPDYNEVAHRMWRARNYGRLEKHYSWMVKFLVAMSVVITHTA